MRRIVAVIICLALPLTACSAPPPEKYQAGFYDLFDTYTTVTGYAESEKKFQEYVALIENEMREMHRLFNVYDTYETVHNIKTINDQAGKTPVTVDARILDMLQMGVDAYNSTNGAVNMAMGSVLKIWHAYRQKGLNDPNEAQLPPEPLLREAAAHTNIQDVIVDRENSTVFLRDPAMSLDVGAIAKGYAVQRAADAAREAGFASGIINAGGNVCVIGRPADKEKAFWSVGIQDPTQGEDSASLADTVSVEDISVVTSGGYQRYYTVNGRPYHHIIDPSTLQPAARYQAVSVLHADSGTAEVLSTALFLLPYEEGKALLSKEGGEGIWIFADNTIQATDGYREVSGYYTKINA